MSKLKTIQKRLPYLYIIAGFISFVSAFIITLDKMKLMADPSYIPPCSINPVIGCGAVMQSWQASLFGFPNPLLGIAGFAIVITVGFAMLSGAKFKQWFWRGMEIGTFLATVFIYWLFYQAVFKIGSLCLYCMVVWAMTIPIFWYTLLANVKERRLKIFRKANWGEWALKYSTWILVAMYLVIALAILIHFRGYFFGGF